jgi:DNA end-binding protein Ku
MKMITQLIDERSAEWSPKMVEDPVQEELKDLIAQRRRKQGKTEPKKAAAEDEAPAADNVIDLMSALKKSLEKPAAKSRGKK